MIRTRTTLPRRMNGRRFRSAFFPNLTSRRVIARWLSQFARSFPI